MSAAVIIQVPIKARPSERVPGKNFREMAGRPLCHHLLDELVRWCPNEWGIVIDSEAARTWDCLHVQHQQRCQLHLRPAAWADNWANGNHLLNQFALAHDAEIYVQVFVTALFLRGETIVRAVRELIASELHDSLCTVTRETGFVWYGGRPVNYDPRRMDGLPRTQDCGWAKETTGLYAIKRQALRETGCRVGRMPILFDVAPEEAFDIDTEKDWAEAEERLGRTRERKTDENARHVSGLEVSA